MNGDGGAYSSELQAFRVRAGAESLTVFAKLYLGRRFSLPWNAMHTELASDLQSLDRTPFRLAVAAPDGYGKTSLLSFALILWVLAYRKKRCIVLGSSSRTAAGEYLSGIDTELRRNDLLRNDFPHLLNIARASGASGSRASPPRLIAVPGIAKVHTIGPSSSLTEVSFEGFPPDLIVLDEFDPGVDDTKVTSQTNQRVDRLERTLRRKILDRFTNASIIITGPLLDAEGLMDRLLSPKHAGSWTQRFYPAVTRYPDQFERWFEWATILAKDRTAADVFLEEHRTRLTGDASVLWPQHESFERLMQLRAEHGWEWFDRYRQGFPPGGTLRAGMNACRSISCDSRSGVVSVVDDAGYQRLLPDDSNTQPDITVRFLSEDDAALGKPVPGSDGAPEGRQF